MATPHFPVNVEDLGHKWGWFLVFGVLLILLGITSLAYTPAATLASVLVLGWLMFFSGIVEAVHAFQARGWVGVLLHVAGGALGIFIGLLVATHPVAGALAWSLLFASFLTVIGLFRMIAASMAAIPKLALGRVRWRRDARSWPAALGGYALVGFMVSRLRTWNCVATSRLVKCNVCVSCSRNRPYLAAASRLRERWCTYDIGEK